MHKAAKKRISCYWLTEATHIWPARRSLKRRSLKRTSNEMQSVSRANVRPRGPKSASRQPSGASGERKETVLHACPARSSEHGFISHRAQPFESQNQHSQRESSLEQHLQRVLDDLLESLQPGRCERAVDDAVVGRERDGHEALGDKGVGGSVGAVVGHHELLGAADGQDARLRSVDDGGELLDAHHAEVGDGEGAADELLGLELVLLGLGR
mmetsp:Transcript_7363/g.16111  ORF Transcript_7363/g.16111 Transcript_7363/m.16111 type:complete len:212 (+) Transcript_7363:223-858(+)